MRNTLILAVLAVSLSACGGRTANPVQIEQYGDASRSCDGLRVEMEQIDANMKALVPSSDKTGKNVALGAAGLVFFPAWFFFDGGGAEKTEMDAYRARYQHLAVLAADKQCGTATAAK